MIPMIGCRKPQAGLDAQTRAVVDLDNPRDVKYGCTHEFSGGLDS